MHRVFHFEHISVASLCSLSLSALSQVYLQICYDKCEKSKYLMSSKVKLKFILQFILELLYS